MAFGLLVYKVKKAAIYGILIVVLLTLLNLLIMAFLNRFYKKMIKYKDNRIDLSVDCF